MKIVTLTLNPALDKSAQVDGIIPEQKLKCHSIQYRPGGGGINVSRVLKRLGVKTTCIFPSGGNTGSLLEKLLVDEQVTSKSIPTQCWTRENLAVVDTRTNNQFRFGMPGNEISKSEIIDIEYQLSQSLDKDDILVISGSLPANLTSNYYAELIRKLKERQIKIVLDTSGPALIQTLQENVFLLKPNQRELAQLAGKEFLTTPEQKDFANQLIQSGQAKYIVVSMGAKGAFLASGNGLIYHSAPNLPVKSTIGAGDSMVAGLIYGLTHDLPDTDILKWGISSGVAATMSEGTNLAELENIKKVFAMFV